MTNPLDIDRVATTNPAVDVEKLNRLRETRKLLEKAGVLRKADYRIAPALGGSPVKPLPPGNVVIRMTPLG